MGDLRLKSNIKVEYDRENYIFRFMGINPSGMKKVTSRAYACLLGQNRWESIGKSILERFSGIEKEQIDPYYMVRGDMAELLVMDYLEKKYKEKKVNIKLETWDKEKVHYDNFQSNPKFGGLIDIAISKPDKYRAVIEVKSKSLKDLDKIMSTKGNIDEVMQGQFLAKLSNVSKCLMFYVFFAPNQEQHIKEYMQTQRDVGQPYDSRQLAKEIIDSLKWSYNTCEIKAFKYDIGDEKTNKEIETFMNTAHKNLIHFKETKTISESYFSIKEKAYLKDLAGYKPTIEDIEDDLPF